MHDTDLFPKPIPMQYPVGTSFIAYESLMFYIIHSIFVGKWKLFVFKIEADYPPVSFRIQWNMRGHHPFSQGRTTAQQTKDFILFQERCFGFKDMSEMLRLFCFS